MEKRIEFEIKPQQEGQTIQQILKEIVGLTPREIRQIKFRENGILRNGRRARCTERVVSGDYMQFLLEAGSSESKWVLWPGPLEVLYEDEDLILVNKPSGMPVHPSPGHYADTLANRLAWYLSEHGQAVDIHLAGRLDKDTSGVVAFAKSRPAAARLTHQRETGKLKKEYLAWVQGYLEPKEGSVCAPIAPMPGFLNRMEVREDGKKAVTHYRVIQEREEFSLLHITLEQGRTHQIRVHMAWAGHPLAGDPIYGSGDGLGFTHAALHAWRLTLEQPFTGGNIVVEAAFPTEWPAL